MRFKVVISLSKENQILPYDHQHFLASYIYKIIRVQDPSYSLDLHDVNKTKPFTFSYIMSQK
ncbi:MAG: hypothetical protein J7K72_02295, partial [Candidatus Aenigmarchaeota archaeon]|nr:hypothetical protein [Candidatus Aenigmarchaeota archaeon]